MDMNDIRVEITDAQPTTVNYEGGSFQKQEAFLHKPGQKYPTRFEVSPPKGKALYQPGMYVLSGESIFIGGRYNQITLNPILLPAGK